MSEAEYLDSIYPYIEEYKTSLKELIRKYNLPKNWKSMYQIELMKNVYEENKNKSKGDVMVCPYCGKMIIKKSYQHKFCNTKCKDKYWNIINPRGTMK